MRNTTQQTGSIQDVKSNHEIFEYNSGYYSIVQKGSMGAVVVFGGDSACEDHYDLEYINYVFETWDGRLDADGLIDIDDFQ